MTALRFALAIALAAIAVGGLPPVKSLAPPAVETPRDDMQRLVTPVVEALKSAPIGDKLLWQQLWEKTAVVVAGDAVATDVVFTDTRSLRAFTILALDIGWRRIGEHKPGAYAGLRTAVETAMESVLSLEVKPVDADVRKAYVEVCRAIAWAGIAKG
jgi:hypothetical protein